MNNTPILFNRRILNNHLRFFDIEQITDYNGKHEELLKWKKTIDNSDLNKTKETSVQGTSLHLLSEKSWGIRRF